MVVTQLLIIVLVFGSTHYTNTIVHTIMKGKIGKKEEDVSFMVNIACGGSIIISGGSACVPIPTFVFYVSMVL